MVYDFADPLDYKDVIELWWGDPQFWEWSDKPVKARIAIALSESHSILRSGRERVISNLNDCDVIICPSQSATLAFMEAPIETPIKVVYFGIDDAEISYIDRDWKDTMKFLHLGATQFRKGSWLVPEAFISAFDAHDDVSLTIGAPYNTTMFTQLKNEYEEHSQITFDNMGKKNVIDWYKDHHVLVSPHLSEGFGLVIPEAMGTGMPVLCSRCSAPREFFDKKYGWWVEMSEMYSPVNECLIDTDGFWRIPDVESLAEVMRNAYVSRQECKEKGLNASKYILGNYTWNHTVKGIKKIIEEVLDEKKGISDSTRV
jgi:glycosyltransferase involved in cell wall biosynthesis